MLRTGKQYLGSIRDGRVIYIGDERVDDATAHPAFRNIAQTYAALYDLKADTKNHDTLSYEEGGERFAMYWLRPRSKADLEKRSRAHTFITEWSFGVLGRPDAQIAMGDAAAFFHRGGLAEDQPGTAQRELAEMDIVPFVGQALAGGVLAHRRYDDAIV